MKCFLPNPGIGKNMKKIGFRLKGWFAILNIKPNVQMSQCVIYHWRLFNTFHSVLLVAEISGARLAQVNGNC